MSIAATSIVGPAVRAAAARIASDGGAHRPDESAALEAPAVAGGRRVAWAVVVIIGCAFSYSIGWQKGWLAGTGESDARFNTLNQTLIETYHANARAEAAPASDLSDSDPVETAAADGGPDADNWRL